MAEEIDLFLTVAEAADFFGVSANAIRNWGVKCFAVDDCEEVTRHF